MTKQFTIGLHITPQSITSKSILSVDKPTKVYFSKNPTNSIHLRETYPIIQSLLISSIKQNMSSNLT